MATTPKKGNQPTEQVETNLKTTDGATVVAVPQEPEREAQPAPEPRAPKVEGDVEITTNIGVRRAISTIEQEALDASGNEQWNTLRDAKEAHKQAAKIGMLAPASTTDYTEDLQGPAMGVEEAEKLVSTRLLFDWLDGQGVLHQIGKTLDLPVNEARKLIAEGFAERGEAPKVETAEDWLAEARAEREKQRSK